MITTAVILAAGRGSRLKEVTANRSKALAPIAGIPIIGRVMNALREAGISRFLVVGAPHDDALRSFCSAQGSITALTQPEPRGSADALKVCAQHLPQRFLVCACDSLVPSTHIRELIQKHAAAQADISLSLMAVSPDTSLAARSVVTLQGDKVLDIIEKPTASERTSNITALPMYCLSDEIFKVIESLPVSPRGEYELPEAFRMMIRKGKDVRGVLCPERLDLTDSRDLLLLNERFLAVQSPQIQIHPSVVVPSSVSLAPPLLIEEGACIGEGASLGPSVYLEKGANVAAGSTLKRVVVLRGASVRGDATGCVVTADTRPT